MQYTKKGDTYYVVVDWNCCFGDRASEPLHVGTCTCTCTMHRLTGKLDGWMEILAVDFIFSGHWYLRQAEKFGTKTLFP